MERTSPRLLPTICAFILQDPPGHQTVKRIAVSSAFAKPPETWVVGIDGTNRTPLSQQAIWDLTLLGPMAYCLAFAFKKDAGFHVGTIDVGGQSLRELTTQGNPYGFALDPEFGCPTANVWRL